MKGPLNTPIQINSIDQFINKFGPFSFDFTGPISTLGSMNQGATDFIINRIAGAGAETSKLILKDDSNQNSVVVEASSPGTWADGTQATGINITVTAGTDKDTVKFVVTVGTKSKVYDNQTVGTIPLIKDPDVVFSISNGANKLPKPITSTPLSGGNNGAQTSDSDYIGTIDASGIRTGLKALEPYRCSIVLAAQQSSPAVQAAVINHVSNAEYEEGLRVAVTTAPKGTLPDELPSIAGKLDTARVNFAYPLVEPIEAPGTLVSPDGYVAGRIAVIGAHESPSNKEIKGILSTERQLTMAELQVVTNAKVMPITPVNGRGFRIRNGVNLSNDLAWSQTSIRRIFDKLEMLIYNVTQSAISEPNTSALWSKISTQIDMILSELKRNGEIYDFKPTVCDTSNNTPESIAERILNTHVRVRPIYAADFIDHSIERLLGDK
jgi:phage tail sheath protein FI